MPCRHHPPFPPSTGPSLQQQGHNRGVQDGVIQVSFFHEISTSNIISSLIGSVTGTTSICLTSSCSLSWRTGDHIDQYEATSLYIDQSQRPRHGHRPHLSPLHADSHRPGQKQQTQQGGLDILQPDLSLLWNLQVPSYNYIEKKISPK